MQTCYSVFLITGHIIVDLPCQNSAKNSKVDPVLFAMTLLLKTTINVNCFDDFNKSKFSFIKSEARITQNVHALHIGTATNPIRDALNMT